MSSNDMCLVKTDVEYVAVALQKYDKAAAHGFVRSHRRINGPGELFVRIERSYLALSAILAAPLAVCPQAWSQSETTSDDRLAEIIVTAQKREQSVQTVGTSVTALDANALQSLGITQATDLVEHVPGLQFNQFSPSVTVFNIRRVSQNDFTDHQEAPVAVYSDEAYVASTGALAGSLFDLDRVEVLRGPQGTLFGRNATGGLIQYVSAKPTDDPEGHLFVTVGNYGEVDTEGAVSGPLSETLAGRVAFATAEHSGYVDNLVGPSLENQRQNSARLQLRFRPSAEFEDLVKVAAANNDHESGAAYAWLSARPDATGRGVLTPGLPDFNGYTNPSSNPWTGEYGTAGVFNRTVWGVTNTAILKSDAVTVTSVTDYQRVQKRYGEDTAASPDPALLYNVFYHFQQFSQELRANGTLRDGALRWVTGAYYLSYRPTMMADADFVPNLVPGIGNSYAQITLRESSPAVFGQLEYDLASQWTLIGGARYTYDKKEMDYTFNSLGATVPSLQQLVHYSPSNNPWAQHSWNIPTGKLELDYKPTAAVMWYASLNRGAKGGGWSAPIVPSVTTATLPYDEERLTSVEGGVKSTFWDGRARLNLSTFYYDYRGYQGYFLDVATSVVENVNAREKGGELEFTVTPAHGLTLEMNVSYLDTTVPFIPTPAGGVVRGQMPQAPHWSANPVARYQWRIAPGQLFVEADAKYNSPQYMELINAPADREGGYVVGNARVGFISANDKWEIDGFVRNLSDKAYLVYGLDLSAAIGIYQAAYGPPRTYGATVRYRWGERVAPARHDRGSAGLAGVGVLPTRRMAAGKSGSCSSRSVRFMPRPARHRTSDHERPAAREFTGVVCRTSVA